MMLNKPKRRGQTLFYTDAVNLLRRIYPPRDYQYRDDFDGEVLISHETALLLSVEIKSEVEADAVSPTNGAKFADVRLAINAHKGLTGKQKGWMACVAQCWDYMQSGLPPDLLQQPFSRRQDVLVMPLDRESDLQGTLTALHDSNSDYVLPSPFILRYPTENMVVFHFEHEQLTQIFDQLKQNRKSDFEPSACVRATACRTAATVAINASHKTQ